VCNISNSAVKRIFYLDQLRALAIIAVVLIHVSLFYFVSSRIDIHSFNWFVSNVFYSMCRFCVPIFLMLSGILLLNKDYNFIEFIKKRYKRVILPFLFWSIVYIIFS
jgi:surface polysaccharide O-acyltransferase-like enzyme